MTYVLEPYDDALKEILKNGVRKKNRTGVDAYTIFGMQKRYRIDTHFPLLTKRKIWPKAVFAELLWMLSGSTNNEDLKKLGCNFWTPWVDEKFEKRHGYKPGLFGPVYGFLMRYFGGYYGNGTGGDAYSKVDTGGGLRHNGLFSYKPKNVYGEGGFDQVQYVLDELKNNPNSRRIMWSMWNPKQLHKMRLPPCHFHFCFFVHEDKLSGHMVQRSCDVPIGCPANIQQYSSLIYMFAQQTGYKPYEFIHSISNAHIYLNQIEAVEKYLSRDAGSSPKLKLNKANDIFSYKIDDFKIIDYKPQPPIKIPVEV